MRIAVRAAVERDAPVLAEIYNQGIEDRGATFETEPRTAGDMVEKLAGRERYPLLVITEDDVVLGWAGLSAYRSRECYAGIAEFSIYLDRQRSRTRPGTAAPDRAGRRGPRARLLEAGLPDLSVEHRQPGALSRLRLS